MRQAAREVQIFLQLIKIIKIILNLNHKKIMDII